MTCPVGFSYNHFLVSREIGGAGFAALNLAAHLRDTGRDVRTWIPGRGPAWAEAEKRRLYCQEFDLNALFSRWKLWAGLANWTIARRLAPQGQGLVHVHSPTCYGGLRRGLSWSNLLRVVHVQIEEDTAGLNWAFKTPPELIVTCARFLVDHVRRALPEEVRDRPRIEAVPNAVDVVKFSPGDKDQAKKKMGARADAPLAVMLANLAPHKGQETAIRAVALLKQRGVALSLWLAGTERGGATFTARLQALIQEAAVGDRVRLLGQRSDAADLLRAADFFLLPSTHEGLPLSILEAQATKVPVLAAPTAGVPEAVTDGETGFLIAAEDAEGYARRLETLVRETALARDVAERAYATVVREYNWNAYCRRIDALYEELTDAHRGRRAARSWPPAA
jgi:glycosyltransferase involved in cell wall biosynthesis